MIWVWVNLKEKLDEFWVWLLLMCGFLHGHSHFASQ